MAVRLTSRDVKWTLDSLLQGKIRSTKTAAYHFVDHIDAPDDFTVIFHMKEADAALLWNLSDGAMGIVPYGSGDEMTFHPIGSGPFKFVSAETDRDVIVERNDEYWGEKAKLARVRFAVVPDATTEALELRKGSADVAINAAYSPDTVITLQREPHLAIERGDGTRLAYLAFNLRDPILKDARVRQAIAYALDRQPMIDYLWRGQARTGTQHSAAAELGLQRRCGAVRSRSREGDAIARRCGISGGERGAFPHHHENFHR
jgi:peptide/nickel transport system substrate-binding protein